MSVRCQLQSPEFRGERTEYEAGTPSPAPPTTTSRLAFRHLTHFVTVSDSHLSHDLHDYSFHSRLTPYYTAAPVGSRRAFPLPIALFALRVRFTRDGLQAFPFTRV